jgi:predicted ATPase
LNCGDLDRAERWARRGIASDPDAISAFWSMAVRCYLGATIALRGDLDAGFAIFDPAWQRYTGQGMRTNCLAFLSCRAQALLQAGQLEQADQVLEEARRELALYDERYAEPLLRQAEASLAALRGNTARATELFTAAATLAATSGSHRIAARVRDTAASYGITLPV